MKDERIIELVNGEVDGTNSPSEHNELTTLLDRDPSVKTLLNELTELDQLLAVVPMVEPPASLKSNIIMAIAHKEAPASAARESLLDRILAPFIQRPAWAAVYAFGIGIVVGLGVFTVIQSPGPEPGIVHGTIGDLKSPALAETAVAVGTATADIVVSGLDDELRIDVTISASEPVTMRIDPAGADPIFIESTSGSPIYSLLIPKTTSIDIEFTSNDLTNRVTLTIDETNAR